MPKTIFHSTEKSNFILNMTEEQFSKLASRGLAIAMLMTPLFTLIPEIMHEGLTSKATYAISAGGLVAGGVIAMIIAIIAFMKKYIGKRLIVPIGAMVIMELWGIFSLTRGVILSYSFYGYPERGEGMLAIIFYFCFFASASALKRETALRTIIDGIVGVGLLNSIIALIQVFGGVLSRYVLITSDTKINAASGLSMSPLFLAMVLTLSLTAALISFISSENKKRSIGMLVCAALFSFVMMYTYSFIGFCGLGFALIAAVAAVFVLKAPKKKLLSVPVSIAAAAGAVALVFAGAIGNISSYRLYDGRILWWADAYMRASASGTFDPRVVDIDDTADVYFYLNRRAMDVIENNPLTGTGPEQLAFAVFKAPEDLSGYSDITEVISASKGSFDKVYNEYLYTSATRGVVSGIALVITVLSSVALGFAAFRKKRSAETFTIFVLTLGGVLIFLIGCSSIPYAPVFWTAAGVACAELKSDKQKKAEKKNAEKTEKKTPEKNTKKAKA
jgi:energy-coupling factor transporter transmembrane protein EcfT